MKRIQQVFWELSSLRFLIASFLTFALYHLMDPFITVWLGEEYILPRSVLIVILTNFFISQFRGTNDQFIFRLRTVSRHMGTGCHTGDNSSGGIGRRLFVGTSGSIAGRYSQFDNRYQYLEALLLYKRGLKCP